VVLSLMRSTSSIMNKSFPRSRRAALIECGVTFSGRSCANVPCARSDPPWGLKLVFWDMGISERMALHNDAKVVVWSQLIVPHSGITNFVQSIFPNVMASEVLPVPRSPNITTCWPRCTHALITSVIWDSRPANALLSIGALGLNDVAILSISASLLFDSIRLLQQSNVSGGVGVKKTSLPFLWPPGVVKNRWSERWYLMSPSRIFIGASFGAGRRITS